MKIPAQIQRYMREKTGDDLAIIGCRADPSNISYECCEYDVAVLNGNNSTDNKIIMIGNATLEFLNVPQIKNNAISLYRMIRPGPDMLSSPSAVDIARSYNAAGKRRITDSLFNAAKNSTKKQEPNLSLNLKMAAYDLLEGILLSSQIRPMPIHELTQLRQLEVQRELINEAMQACIESLGIERATRTIINRSFKAFKEIFRERYDLPLLSSKIEFLLHRGLVADCYYYIGKLVCSHLQKSENALQKNYHKLNSIALDLSSDTESTKKKSEILKIYCKSLLKN